MKVLLTAINAKYIHTSLSVRCLYRALKGRCDVQMAEYTINEQADAITGGIYRCGADVVAFSCYIWNISLVLQVCADLKQAAPNCKILLGGYEVSYDPETILRDHPAVDYILCGEGEASICELVDAWQENRLMDGIGGLVWRQGDQIHTNPPRQSFPPLDALPFVYDGGLDVQKGQIVYYETSRGCPYACAYCLSGAPGNVRFLSLERVKRELQFFIDNEVPLVKLVDRTFNADVRRAREIFRYLIQHPGKTRFHFELAGDLLDDETLELLKHAPPGLIQFEIGIQSTNQDTISSVSRNISFDRLSDKIVRLLAMGNIHVHVDLIAGLPYEGLDRFRQSVNQVLALRPHVLQLGFLKLLKGSRLRVDAAAYGYRYQPHPPYEVIANHWMSYADILELKDVEDILDRYYNSGCFSKAMAYLFGRQAGDCYAVLHHLAVYFRGNGLFDRSLPRQALYQVMAEQYAHFGISFLEALTWDYVQAHPGGNLPSWSPIQLDEEIRQKLHAYIGNAEWVGQRLPHLVGMHPKQIAKRVQLVPFSAGIYLFDQQAGVVLDVSQDFCCKNEEMPV